MAITLTDEQLSDLLNSLEGNPQAVNIRGEIRCKLNSVITDYDFIVDNWPDYKALVVCVNPIKAKFHGHLGRLISVYAKDSDALEMLLQTPSLLDWSKPLIFFYVSGNSRPVVEKVIRQHNMPYKIKNICLLKATKETHKLIPIPEGFKLERLKPDQGNLVSSLWGISSGKPTAAYINHIVTKVPSCCLYNQEGTVVGFAVRYHYGSLGMLNVAEEYRGKGYGKVIMSHLVDSCLKIDQEVFSITEKENIPAVKLHEGIGFRQIPESECQEFWVNT